MIRTNVLVNIFSISGIGRREWVVLSSAQDRSVAAQVQGARHVGGHLQALVSESTTRASVEVGPGAVSGPWSWSSFVVGDEGSIGPSGKLLCL